MKLVRPGIFAACLFIVAATSAPIAAAVDYSRDVRPILEKSCYSCHGPDKQKAELRLDVRSLAMKGGESGAAIVPSKSSESLLIKLVRGEDADRVMPAKGARLSEAQIAILREWIDSGAAWPDDGVRVADKRDHWSLKPVVRVEPPAVSNRAWERNAIDRFILARLEKEHLAPRREADRRTLIRRVSFDLIGLPPTPEEVEAFMTDRSVDAYEKVVDRLLASPRFGERWARHWLDVVRYGDSHGFEMNQPRPNAWPYRDWVIRALNEDMPYDQFVREQIAGDALGADAATGFLVAGPWDQVKSPDPALTAQQRADELHDMVAVTGSAFLGLTVGCARCHDHKFDPISQVDYYRMVALFAGVRHGERALPLTDESKRELAASREKLAAVEGKLTPFIVNNRLGLTVTFTENEERFAAVQARFVRFTISATSNAIEPCIDELEIYTAEEKPRNAALASAGGIATASGTYAGNPSHKLEHLNDGRYGNSQSWISNQRGKGWVQIELAATARIDRIVWGRDREGKYRDRLPTSYAIEVATDAAGPWRQVAGSEARRPFAGGAAEGPRYAAESAGDREELARLLTEQKSLKETVQRLGEGAKIYAGQFEQPGATHRLNRGEALSPKEAVTPGGLAAVLPGLDLPADAPERERRVALAKWLTNPANPLTARVIVNRLWQHHFGRGLVATPSDFGHMGGTPTHPELLDWLASELAQGGWRMKAIHRLIVCSAAYRQSSDSDPTARAADGDASLLWRFPPQRLQAESIRDSILAVSGKLDLTAGGPGFDFFKPNTNYVRVYEPKEDFSPAEFRRMIYAQKPRLQADGVFGAFDCPDAGQTQPRRASSTTPLQAMNLLNSRFVLQQSEFLAERLRRDAGEDAAAQVGLAFRLAFAREVTEREREAAVVLIRGHGLAAFCRAVFNANEFLYVQ
ncbi:MAG: Planctomycete cytochrome [Phycisphaerales bacterium]|nr:Planctomycete cytochrome [Phycisphaerales bacterium]